jgi:ketosteroid isomerase-like protein
MKKRRRASTLVATSILSPAPIPSAALEIRALRDASNLAIAARDLPAIASALADDFVVIIGDGTLLTRATYLEAFAHTFAQPVPLRYERIADTIHLSASLPLAAEHGHWVGIQPGIRPGSQPEGAVLFTGTYMAMWRHSAAGWKLRSELFVTLT